MFFLLKSVTNFFQSVFQEFSPEYLPLLLMIILLFYVLFPAQVAIGGCVHRDPGCNRRLVKCGIISSCRSLLLLLLCIFCQLPEPLQDHVCM